MTGTTKYEPEIGVSSRYSASRTIALVAAAAAIAATFTVLSGVSRSAEPGAGGSGQRDSGLRERACSYQNWPYYAPDCLRRDDGRVIGPVRIVPIDTPQG